MIKDNKYFKFLLAFTIFSFSFLEGSDIISVKFDLEISANFILVVLTAALILGLVITYKGENKKPQVVEHSSPNQHNYSKYLNVILSCLILALFVVYFTKDKANEDLFEVKLPAIQQAYDEGDEFFVFHETYKLLEDKNPLIESFYNKVTQEVSLFSNPEGVDVYFKFYSDTTETWIPLGKTPLENVRVPSTLLKLKFDDNGVEYSARTHPYYLKTNNNIFTLPIDYEETERYQLFLGRNTPLNFPGLDHLPNVAFGPYLMSKYEVTNSEYQKFVDDDGYDNSEYWDFPITLDGEVFEFEKIIETFIGEFGKKGPKNWTYSKHPKDQENYPVTGISWFEARAYANYMDMSLPNVYQWSNSANLGWSSAFVPKSNYSHTQLNNVGGEETHNYEGLYDIAGNVREWCLNSHNEEHTEKSILGGNFLDYDYMFNDYYGQNIFDRSIGNGCRLSKNLKHEAEIDDTAALNEIFIKVRDFFSLPGISDEVFEVYRSQYDNYSKDLNAKVIELELTATSDIKVERYEIPSLTPDDNIIPGYVFYDSSIPPPYKPIIYFPGSNAIHLTNTDIMLKDKLTDMHYLISEGYAVIHPIYTGTYEKADALKSDYPERTQLYKDHVIIWGKEYKKTIDYIESREDLDIETLSYFGVSWGGAMANILLAIDDRVKAAILDVAGLSFQETYKEIEAYHYTSRITCPVLMLNGKYDVYFPLETSQKPMFHLLATDDDEKKHYVYPSGHYVPKKEIIKEHLHWLDIYLN